MSKNRMSCESYALRLLYVAWSQMFSLHVYCMKINLDDFGTKLTYFLTSFIEAETK